MIHSTAIIGGAVALGVDVHIGPYSVLDGDVKVGDRCRIGPHCHITGQTEIGENTRIHAGAVIGDDPQDHSFDGAVSFTKIGRHCHIREYATVHRGAEAGTATVIEDNVMVMGFVHIGHNCHLHAGVVIANMSVVSGHVEIGKRAFVSSGTLVHQFVRIGDYTMISARARIVQDVPPYCLLAEGDCIYGINTVGLRRAGFPQDVRRTLNEAVKTFYFKDLNRDDALDCLRRDYPASAEVGVLIDFIAGAKRGTMPGRPKRGKSTTEMSVVE